MHEAGVAGIMSYGEHEWQDRMGKAGECNGLHNAGAVGGLRQQGYNLAWASGGWHGMNRLAAVQGRGGSGGIPEKRADVQKGHIGGMVAITVCKVHIGSVSQGEKYWRYGDYGSVTIKQQCKCKRKYWRGGFQKKGWKSSVSLRYCAVYDPLSWIVSVSGNGAGAAFFENSERIRLGGLAEVVLTWQALER